MTVRLSRPFWLNGREPRFSADERNGSCQANAPYGQGSVISQHSLTDLVRVYIPCQLSVKAVRWAMSNRRLIVVGELRDKGVCFFTGFMRMPTSLMFELNHLGTANWLLGGHITYFSERIVFSQRAYIDKMLKRCGMESSRPAAARPAQLRQIGVPVYMTIWPQRYGILLFCLPTKLGASEPKRARCRHHNMQ